MEEQLGAVRSKGGANEGAKEEQLGAEEEQKEEQLGAGRSKWRSS